MRDPPEPPVVLLRNVSLRELRESRAALSDWTWGCSCWFCCSMKVLLRSRSDRSASIRFRGDDKIKKERMKMEMKMKKRRKENEKKKKNRDRLFTLISPHNDKRWRWQPSGGPIRGKVLTLGIKGGKPLPIRLRLEG